VPRRKKTESTGVGPKTRDYFAELYIAGMMGDRGWAVYFPKRDIGFDFVASKKVGDKVILRPIQVRGKYPTAEKKDKVAYNRHNHRQSDGSVNRGLSGAIAARCRIQPM
jgi:hypothetical protein